MKYDNRRRLGRIMVLLGLLVTVIALLSSGIYIKSRIGPNMERIGIFKAEGMVNSITNRVIEECFSELRDPSVLLDITRDSEGNVTSIESDTKAMNMLTSGVLVELQKRYDECADRKITVPLGSLLGSRVLSQAGIDVTLRIMPVTVSKVDFITKMSEHGINQTKYKVYIRLTSQVEILAPFSSETFAVKNNVLLAEAVVLGPVPDNYVFIPEEDITDTID